MLDSWFGKSLTLPFYKLARTFDVLIEDLFEVEEGLASPGRPDNSKEFSSHTPTADSNNTWFA